MGGGTYSVWGDVMGAYEEIRPLLPSVYGRQLQPADFTGLEELRLFAGQPLRLRYGHLERELYPEAAMEDLEEILQRACQRSVYAYRETICRGFVTVDGGHRIGICGQGVLNQGCVQALHEPTALNIRIARTVPGFGDQAIGRLQASALILGPPGSGKTTLLRDLVCQLSDKKGKYVSLIDERGELAGTHYAGKRTSVLQYIPKSTAIEMQLRTMGPEWIAVDEITSPEDILAMEQASHCGVDLLATAHGYGLSDLQNRPLYRHLTGLELFKTVIVLQKDKSYWIQEVDI